MTMQHRNGDFEFKISADGMIKLDKLAREKEIRISQISMASKRIVDDYPDLAGWFGLGVMTGCEYAVEKRLDDLAVRVAVPTYKTEEIRRRGRTIPASPRPIIRGYVFVECVPSPSAFIGLRHVDDVISIVGCGNRVFRFESKTIKRFIDMAKAGAINCEPTLASSFKPGMSARITMGAFASSTAVIVARKGTKKGDREIAAEIPVDVNIFGRMTRVMMPIAFLELL
jgi:transcriptional antiterminator NusG